MNAADILTIHQIFALISELLRPGQPDCPRLLVASGDQLTYKMLVNIWRNSLLEPRGTISGDGSSSRTRVHEWFIQFCNNMDPSGSVLVRRGKGVLGSGKLQHHEPLSRVADMTPVHGRIEL